MSDADQGAREFEATQQKLDAARKKGDIPRSADLTAAVGLVAFALVGYVKGPDALRETGAFLTHFLARPEQTAAALTLGAVLAQIAESNWPWLAVPAAAIALSLIAARSFAFAPDRVAPDLKRIDPVHNAARRFGSEGLVEFAKSAVKLCAACALFCAFLWGRRNDISGLMNAEGGPAFAAALGLFLQFIALVAALAAAIGVADFLWQKISYLRRNRMSRRELTDEARQSEGDPQMKALRRRKAVELAARQSIAKTAEATVVIVNPTHYAVALKWRRGEGRAPVCVAKGADLLAARIREIAREADVPIHSDPPTARALYASVEVDQEISPEHYVAVAAAVRFAERLRGRAKRG